MPKIRIIKKFIVIIDIVVIVDVVVIVDIINRNYEFFIIFELIIYLNIWRYYSLF